MKRTASLLYYCRSTCAALVLLGALFCLLPARFAAAAEWRTYSLESGKDAPLSTFNSPAPAPAPTLKAPEPQPIAPTPMNQSADIPPELIERVENAKRQALVKKLTKLDIDAPEVLPTLLDIIDILPTNDKSSALWVLTSLVTSRPALEKTLPVLVRAAADEDVNVRIAVIGVVAEARKKIPDADEALLGLVDTLDGAGPVQAQGVATIVGVIGAKAVAAIPALTRHLNSTDPRTKLCAALSLAAISKETGKDVVPALAEAAENPVMPLPERIAAVLALGKFGPVAKPAIPALLRASQDAFYILRSAALDAAVAAASDGKNNPPELVPALLAGLADPDKIMHNAAAIGFGIAGPETPGVDVALPALEKCLTEDEPGAPINPATGKPQVFTANSLRARAAWALSKLVPGRLEKMTEEQKIWVAVIDEVFGAKK